MSHKPESLGRRLSPIVEASGASRNGGNQNPRSAKPLPNDIDLIAVLRQGHDFERELLISQYWLVSRGLLRRRFGFDVFVAESGSPLYKKYVEFFSRVREAPGGRKGLLRVLL
jgi:hypothetical protein